MAFREKFGFPYDLLSDTDGAMSRAYGAAGEGAARPKRISVLIGPDGRVVRRYDTVVPTEHPQGILADAG